MLGRYNISVPVAKTQRIAMSVLTLSNDSVVRRNSNSDELMNYEIVVPSDEIDH